MPKFIVEQEQREPNHPPHFVARVAREMHRGSLLIEPRAHELFSFIQLALAIGNLRYAEQNVPPIDHRRIGPQVGLDRDTSEQRRVGVTIHRERVDCRELANRQVSGLDWSAADDLPLDEISESSFEL